MFQTAFTCPTRPGDLERLEAECMTEYKAMKKAKYNNSTGQYADNTDHLQHESECKAGHNWYNLEVCRLQYCQGVSVSLNL